MPPGDDSGTLISLPEDLYKYRLRSVVLLQQAPRPPSRHGPRRQTGYRVTGATGHQGGSVVHFLLQDGSFRVRALTRKPRSSKAKELQGKGVEVVFADFDDQESLENALQGAYGVFGVTNFWESMDSEKEERHGKTLVDAAKACNVQHFVWSTVSAPPNDLDIRHWTSKARVNEYLLLSSGLPRTSLYSTFYFENFLLFDFAKLSKSKSSDESPPTRTRKYVANWPLLLSDGPIGGFSVMEIGAYALEIFKDPKKWIGKDLYIPPDVFTPRTFVDAINDALSGKATVELTETDEDAFAKARTLGPGSEELWTNMMGFYRAGGKMRNMIPPSSSSSKTDGTTNTSAGAAYSEEIEEAIFPNRLSMKSWVKEHVDEILALAIEL